MLWQFWLYKTLKALQLHCRLTVSTQTRRSSSQCHFRIVSEVRPEAPESEPRVQMSTCRLQPRQKQLWQRTNADPCSCLHGSWSMQDYFLIPRSQKSLSLTRVNFTSDSRDTPKGSLKSGLFITCRWSSSIIHFSPAFISDRKFKKKRKPLIKSTCIAVFQVFLAQSLSSGVVDGNIEHFWAAGTDAAKNSWFDLAVATHSPFVYTFLNNPVFQGKPREIQSQVCSPHSLRGTSFIQLLPLDKRCFSWEEPLFPFPLFQKHSFWLKPG